MILRVNNNELILVSEDPMDAKYLESLFEGSIQVVKEIVPICRGFCITDDQIIRIKLTKKEISDEDT